MDYITKYWQQDVLPCAEVKVLLLFDEKIRIILILSHVFVLLLELFLIQNLNQVSVGTNESVCEIIGRIADSRIPHIFIFFDFTHCMLQ